MQRLVHISASLTQARKPPYPENLQVQVFMGDIFPFKRRCNKAHKSKGINACFAVRSNTMPIIFVKEGVRGHEFLNMRMSF